MATIIANGTVYLERGAERCDLLLAEGKISRIGRRRDFPQDCHVIDAAGLAVLPGLIDFHVHVDDKIGRWYLADTYRTGSMAAVLNGITTLISFVTQRPGQTLPQATVAAQLKATHYSYCDVAFHHTPTTFAERDWDEIRFLMQCGHRTFKFYTTYRDAGLYQSYAALRELLKRFAKLGARVLVHCEDEAALTGAAQSEQDFRQPAVHARLRAPEAEVTAIGKVTQLAAETGCAVHIVHVSTADGAEVIRQAREHADVTCETAPQYLYFNKTRLAAEDGQRYLCSPPLRSEANRGALETLAGEGAFDIFATDHCAFSVRDKDEPHDDIRACPNGLAGIGALTPLMHELLVTRGKRTWSDLALRLAKNPARLAGLYPHKGCIREDADADLILVADDGAARELCPSYADCHNPYVGRTTTLDFRYVLVRGETVVQDNELVTPNRPLGQVIWPI